MTAADADFGSEWNAALTRISHLAGVRTVELTCGAVPVQLEGTLVDGRHFYFRGRFERVQLGVGVTGDAAVAETIDGGAAWIDREDAGWLDAAATAELFAALLHERTQR